MGGEETYLKVRGVGLTEPSPFPEVCTVRSMEELAELQAQDPELAPIVRLRLHQTDQPTFDEGRAESTETKFYWAQWTRLIVREGVVFGLFLTGRAALVVSNCWFPRHCVMS